MIVQRVMGLLIFIMVVPIVYGKPHEVISITIDNPVKRGMQTKRMKLFMGVLKNGNQDLARMLPFLQADLELSKQFKLTVEEQDALPKTKHEITDLYNKGYVLAFFINSTQDGKAFEWRLYNTTQAYMEKGKRCAKLGTNPADWGHTLAHDMWLELMGSPGSFFTRLCYIKKVPDVRYKSVSQLCLCDIVGGNEHVLQASSRITIAPYWSLTRDNPYLVYSEFTDANVRLVSIDLHGNRRIVLDFDGTTAGVSFQPEGGDIIYGRSGGIWRYAYDPALERGTHTLLIKEDGACASPSLLSNGDIIYCSQGKIKYYNSKACTREILVGDGYNVGPALHEKSNKVVYSRRIKGDMQLFVYNLKTKSNEQLTFDQGDKTDPCWSPCGTWAAFCTERKGKSRIAIFNVKTHHAAFITSAHDHCRYPAWSPVLGFLP